MGHFDKIKRSNVSNKEDGLDVNKWKLKSHFDGQNDL